MATRTINVIYNLLDLTLRSIVISCVSFVVISNVRMYIVESLFRGGDCSEMMLRLICVD